MDVAAFLKYYYEFDYNNTYMYVYPINHILPVSAVVLYVLAVFLIPRVISKPVKFVEKIIVPWNFFLWISSVLMFVGGFYGIYQHFARLDFSFFKLICDTSVVESTGPLMFWTYLFAISKYFELFDTIWIVLKHPNKPVEFLHWWHHITVLLFTWYATYLRYGLGEIFFLMNALVHSFMYYYYFNASLGMPPKWGKLLTLGQILQMVIGTILNTYWFYLYQNGIFCTCRNPDYLIISCALMYGSYLYLFVMFFINKYSKKDLNNKKD